MQDVTFPTITICNLNKIEASFLKELNIYGDQDAVENLMKEFIDGRNGNKSQQEEAEIKQVNDFIGTDYSFLQFSRQKCRDLLIQISYQVCCEFIHILKF